MAGANAAGDAIALALGTVQFGLAYGALGTGHPVSSSEATRILEAAWHDGVRTLDTAAAYGDIEARLTGLCGSLDFRIISKIRPLSGLSACERLEAMRAGIEQTRRRLGERLGGLMFHSAADLLAEDGPELWAQAQLLMRGSALPLGVSCYAPAELMTLRQQFDIRIAQLPCNALDQRLPQWLKQHRAATLNSVEIHVRSAFLQGLLLAPERGAQRVPAAAHALQRWRARCAVEDLQPAVAALGVVKAAPSLSTCVIGVESLAQWQEISAAWQMAPLLHWPDLACDESEAIDPRLWPPTPVDHLEVTPH